MSETKPMKVDPLTVECPSCGALVGDRCWSGTRPGRRLQRGSHRSRERFAAGGPEDFQAYLRRELHRIETEVLSKRKP